MSSASRPYADHQARTLRALLESPNVGDVQKGRIRQELALRDQLAELDAVELVQAEEPPKGTRPEDRMNKTEARFARYLDALVAEGRYVDYWFEHLKLRVGVERDWYTVDFIARRPDGLLDAFEVKGGHIHEDSVEKFKAAALLYGFMRWRMMQWEDGAWKIVYDYDREVAA